MATQHTARGQSGALKGRELRIHLEEASEAPAEVVYDLIADIRTHLEWAGTRQPKEHFRLLSIEAPEGPAYVGTEFSSTGADPLGRFADSSVVTEASRPGMFEFVTEARLSMKKDKLVEWTNIHRYEIATRIDGCLVSYTFRVVRISDLPGEMAMFKIPGLRSVGLRISGSFARRGLYNLARLAEERAMVR